MNDAYSFVRKAHTAGPSAHKPGGVRDEDQWFQKIVENTFQWTWEVDERLTVTSSSERVEEVLGYSAGEMLGKTFEDLIPQENLAWFSELANQILREKKTFHDVEMWAYHKNGQRVCLLNSGVPIFEREGRFRGFKGVTRDITPRKRIEEALRNSEERYRTLIENQGEGTALVDECETFAFSNPAAEEIFGVARGGLVGRSLFEFVDPSCHVLVSEQTRERKAGRKSSYEVTIRRPDGQQRIILLTATPQCDEQGVYRGAFGVFRDITDRRRAEEELRRRSAQLEALRQVSLSITAELELDSLLHTITERALALFQAEAGVLYLYRIEREALEQVVALGIQESRVSWEMRRGEGLSSKIWASGEPVILDKYAFWPEHEASREGFVWGSAIGAPIRWRGEFLGVLGILSKRPKAFTSDELEMLQLFATQAAVAIINARLYAKVEHLALVDELTGAFNRRGLFALGSREVERSRRFSHRLSALFIDVDYFKEVNDRHSHEDGDRMLRAVCQQIRECVRDVDLVSRYGGDEFVVLLVETDLAGAREVAERLRQAIQDFTLTTGKGAASVTVSVGISGSASCMNDLGVLVHCADQAMYKAKQSGKNQVITFDR